MDQPKKGWISKTFHVAPAGCLSLRHSISNKRKKMTRRDAGGVQARSESSLALD
jgi:hypothetical protein